MGASDTKVWATMKFRDADAMIRFLQAVGFSEHSTYRDDQDPSIVVHAEWLWPSGGGIMFGSVRPGADGVERAGLYVVCVDPDDVVARAVAAGATVENELVDNDYGGRSGGVRDLEGNLWTFGSYQPA